jgi:hypothetical protein
VWEARVFVKGRRGGPGRQITKTFKGGKREVARQIADWEREVQGAAAAATGMTVAELLELWQESRAPQWQLTTAREHRHRSAAIAARGCRIRIGAL